MDDNTMALVVTLTTIGNQIKGTKHAALGLYICMLYDHLLTLPEEIEYIWKRKFTAVTALFIMTRYYSATVLLIAMVGFFSKAFTPEVCERYALFLPFGGGMPLTFFPNIVLAIRVYALYKRNIIIGLFLTIYLLAEFSVAMWIYCTPGAHPLRIPPQVANVEAFHICIEIVSESLGNIRSALFQFMQTIYDTIVFVMIIYRTASIALSKRTNANGERRENVMKMIASHGLLYYGVIFSSNFLWAMMIIFAPEGLQYSTALPTLSLVCTMVNRITLDLRSFGSPQLDSSNAVSPFARKAHNGHIPTPPTLPIMHSTEGKANGSFPSQDGYEDVVDSYEMSVVRKNVV